MAYARWSFSKWYIFWAWTSAKRKEDELLAIWYVNDERNPHFSYAQLKDIQSIQDLKELLKLDIPDEEYEECLECIKIWLKEVDEAYEEGTMPL